MEKPNNQLNQQHAEMCSHLPESVTVNERKPNIIITKNTFCDVTEYLIFLKTHGTSCSVVAVTLLLVSSGTNWQSTCSDVLIWVILLVAWAYDRAALTTACTRADVAVEVLRGQNRC